MFTDIELPYLDSQRIGRLATVQPNGTLQASPVGFAINGDLGTIDIVGFDLTRSQKFRNVRDNGRVAFVVDDIASTDPWRVRCVEIRGHAEALDSDGAADSPALIRIHPRRIISFGIDGLDTEPHEMVPSKRTVG